MRRINFPRQTVEIAFCSLVALVIVVIVLLIHGLTLQSKAQESRKIAQENMALKHMSYDMQVRMPTLRHMLRHASLNFTQLWSKSGLGNFNSLEDNLDDQHKTERITDILALTTTCDSSTADGMALQITLENMMEYLRDSKLLLSNTPSIRPAHTPWLSSSFGKRKDPILKNWVMHKGLDMAGPIGMKVHAPADGVVIWVGSRGGYGQTVVIDHGYGLQTHFAHLSKYLTNVGSHVHRGEPIAEIGSTGRSTGPHLHYEVRRWGQPIDPSRFILD